MPFLLLVLLPQRTTLLAPAAFKPSTQAAATTPLVDLISTCLLIL